MARSSPLAAYLGKGKTVKKVWPGDISEYYTLLAVSDRGESEHLYSRCLELESLSNELPLISLGLHGDQRGETS